MLRHAAASTVRRSGLVKRSSTRSCEVAIQRSKTKPGERLPYLLSKLKAPRVLERLEQTAVLAREQDWPFERFLETLLPRSRSCVPRPARRDRGVCERVHRVAFATAQEWVSPLGQAHDCNQLEQELRRLERYHLLVADEVGYLPFRQAANLLFALVSRRYERGSIIVTSNRGFEQCGEILGDAMVAAALIDRVGSPGVGVLVNESAQAAARVDVSRSWVKLYSADQTFALGLPGPYLLALTTSLPSATSSALGTRKG